jgi:RNA polymerase sigma-70 factor, ECF subfamily
LNFHSFDDSYLKKLAGGDPLVEDHFSAYFGDLLRLKLRVRLRSPALVEDVLQETLLRVLDAVRRGSIEQPERFGAFVNAVSNNVMRELLRGETRFNRFDEAYHEPIDEAIDLDAPLVDGNRRRQVQSVLDEMTPKDREILQLCFLEERDRTEICRRFQVSEDYLRVVLHRAKERFRVVYKKKAGGIM